MAHQIRKTATIAVACIVFLAGPLMALAAEPVEVAHLGGELTPRQPQVAVGDDGVIHVAFGVGDTVYCSTSADGGKSYGDRVEVGTVKRLALGMRRGPRIAAGAETVVITAVSHDDGRVLAWRSNDEGRTWTGPVSVNDNSPATANEGLQALAAAPNGDLHCVWLDHRINGKNQIFGAVSVDGGRTWSENRLVYRSPSGTVCECCHPATTFDSEGALYVMWRNSLSGSRDMYATVSRDGGKTFSKASKLGSGTWKLDACPMDGGYLAATKPGQVTTVWRRDTQIFRSESSRGDEQLLGTGQQPWVSGTPEGAWVVWLSQRPGDLWLAAPNTRQPVKLAGNASDPVIASSPGGKGPIVTVWEAGRGREARIMALLLGD